MTALSLTKEERQELESLLAEATDTRLENRIRGLLTLSGGYTVEDVAENRKVSRSTVYNWIHRFLEDRSLSIVERLSDKPRSGRPRKKSYSSRELISMVREMVALYPNSPEVKALGARLLEDQKARDPTLRRSSPEQKSPADEVNDIVPSKLIPIKSCKREDVTTRHLPDTARERFAWPLRTPRLYPTSSLRSKTPHPVSNIPLKDL